MCAVRDLTKTYRAVRGRRGAPGTPEVQATDAVDLDVRRGEIFGLLGPNGAGKSTLVRQITGLMRPDRGSVEILGHDIVRHPERAARILAYLGQESSALDELTVSLAVETTARLRGLEVRQARAERDAVLEELGLTALAPGPSASSPAGNDGSRASPPRSSGNVRCSSSTNRRPGWTRWPGGRCGRRSTGGAPSAVRRCCW